MWKSYDVIDSMMNLRHSEITLILKDTFDYKSTGIIAVLRYAD